MPRHSRLPRRECLGRHDRTLEPGLVSGRSVNAWDLPSGHSEIDRELASVMNLIAEEEPPEVHSGHIDQRLRPTEELDRLEQLVVGVRSERVTKVSVRGFEGDKHGIP